MQALLALSGQPVSPKFGSSMSFVLWRRSVGGRPPWPELSAAQQRVFVCRLEPTLCKVWFNRVSRRRVRGGIAALQLRRRHRLPRFVLRSEQRCPPMADGRGRYAGAHATDTARHRSPALAPPDPSRTVCKLCAQGRSLGELHWPPQSPAAREA